MDTADILRAARNVLLKRGWHQGDLEGDDGAVCARGALNIATTGDPRAGGPGTHAAECALIEATDHSVIDQWNDASDRTFDEVIDAFGQAEKLAEPLLDGRNDRVR